MQFYSRLELYFSTILVIFLIGKEISNNSISFFSACNVSFYFTLKEFVCFLKHHFLVNIQF